MPQQLPRRPAAVMFTDVVGYTTLVQGDEEAARVVRQRHREALEAAIATGGGELVQYLGDGSLSTFPSAVRAVSAAVEIQQALSVDVPLRIGVHQGEIAFDEHGIYGDSVNVAARVMTMGIAGSVLLSDKVQDELKNQRDFSTASLGIFDLKNVRQPLELYAVTFEGLAVPTRNDLLASVDSARDPVTLRYALAGALGQRYSNVVQIGQGGMAVVFRAVDERLNRAVAVKVMSPALSDDVEAKKRFVREARAAAAMSHPNVVPIYTVDAMPDGLPYFCMQYVDGGSLGDVIESEAPLPPAQVESFLRQIASALDAAHRQGIIHRDIKPQNILLEVDGARLLLTDFGIAKGVDETSTVLTAVGSLLGSPRYMSPEQAAGDPLDQRSDLYSMGVVAFEMLTGKAPFEAKTIQRMIICHLTEPPPSLHEARPDCPTALLDAVHRCLEKEAGQRYQSAGELIEYLDEARRAGGSRQNARGPLVARLHPLRKAQLVVLAAVAGGILTVALDARLLGGATLSAVGVTLAVLVIVETAAHMWVEGFELLQLFTFNPRGPEHPSRERREVVAGGVRAELIRRCRAERALVIRAFHSLARSEQSEFPQLRSTADQLYREIAKTARELNILDRRIEAPEGEVISASRLSPARQREEFEEAHERLELNLEDSITALKRIREAISDYASLGGTVGLDPIQESLEIARARLGRAM